MLGRPGLVNHPTSRMLSLESEEEIRRLSNANDIGKHGGRHGSPKGANGPNEGIATAVGDPNQQYAPLGGDASAALDDLLEEDDGLEVSQEKSLLYNEMHEMLEFQDSIYDLTVQYSCLAVHGSLTDSVGYVNLLCVLALQLLNLFLQMNMLFEVRTLITLPAMAKAQSLYQIFTWKVYGADADDSRDAGRYAITREVFDNFEAWEDDDKYDLCQIPLMSPSFFFLILLIWTFFLGHELKQTCFFAGHIFRLEKPNEGYVEVRDLEDAFVITRMSRGLKCWILTTVFAPKLAIAMTLWIVGARWLTATSGFENLVLNALALTFICDLDELIFRACVSEATKASLAKTRLPLPSITYAPTLSGPVESFCTVLVCVGLSALFIFFFQDAIPAYRWDLGEFCAGLDPIHIESDSRGHGRR